VHQNTICRLIIFLFGFEILHETAGGKGNFKMPPGANIPASDALRNAFLYSCIIVEIFFQDDLCLRDYYRKESFDTGMGGGGTIHRGKLPFMNNL
jgi:hypothetical protein